MKTTLNQKRFRLSCKSSCLFKAKSLRKLKNGIKWILGMSSDCSEAQDGMSQVAAALLRTTLKSKRWKLKKPLRKQINLNFRDGNKISFRLTHSAQMSLLLSCLECHKASSQFHLMDLSQWNFQTISNFNPAIVIVCGSTRHKKNIISVTLMSHTLNRTGWCRDGSREKILCRRLLFALQLPGFENILCAGKMDLRVGSFNGKPLWVYEP